MLSGASAALSFSSQLTVLVVAVVPISKPNDLLPEVDLHRCVAQVLFLSKHSRSLCAECFFQVKPPREDATCPFCNKQHFQVVNLGPRSDQEVQAEQMVRGLYPQ